MERFAPANPGGIIGNADGDLLVLNSRARGISEFRRGANFLRKNTAILWWERKATKPNLEPSRYQYS